MWPRDEPDDVTIVWAELPTPDVVVVQYPEGGLLIVADVSLSRRLIARIASSQHVRTLGRLGTGMLGTGTVVNYR